MAALFISDLHIPPEGGAVCGALQRFLADVPGPGDSLYVLGDLFEYWAGDDDIGAAGNRRVVDLLADTAHRGVRQFWIAGNRDFLTGAAFASAACVTPLTEPCVLDLAGERTVLLHGDVLCTDDHDYQAFRHLARSAEWQRSFLARPLEERLAEIRTMRERSEHEKSVKSMAIMDVNAGAVEKLFTASGATRMIHGHTHRPARHLAEVNGHAVRRWVLPAWESGPAYLRVDESGEALTPID